jgi:hypothetical protein
VAQSLAARCSEFVELGAAIVIGRAPVCLEESLADQAIQSWIERTLFNEQRPVRDLLDAQKNAVPVERPRETAFRMRSRVPGRI